MQGNSLNLQGGNAPIQGSSGSLLQGSGSLASILQPAAAPVGTLVGSKPAANNSPAPASNVNSSTLTGQPSTDQNAISYYNDVINQLQAQLDATKGEESTGINNITNAYNKSVNEQNQAESNAESGFASQRAQNGVQRENNINTINDQSRGLYSSLMGILGANGAGVSSAATVGAPQAIAKSASGQRAGADTAYNTNASAINTAEDQTKQSYKNALDDLLVQKNTNTQNFLSGLLGTEGTLEQQIRDAQINRSESGGQTYAEAGKGAGNTTQAVKNIQSQLQDIFNKYATPSFSVNPVTVSTPNLTSFSVDPTTIKSETTNPTTDSSFAPYLASLKNNNVLTGGAPATAATAGAAL